MNRRKRVLIVDKDEGVLISLEHLLEDEGFDTRTTWSAREALEYALSQRCDLLVMGDQLPDLSCEQLLREIQRNSGVPSVLVIASAAPQTPAVASYFMSLGAAGAVRKRNLGEVVDRVKALCSQTPTVAVRAA
ncbi:MAG TPA: response regulator [Terriglobales bacterium]|nr:response regulator [Terriglobales bacterium]